MLTHTALLGAVYMPLCKTYSTLKNEKDTWMICLYMLARSLESYLDDLFVHVSRIRKFPGYLFVQALCLTKWCCWVRV